MSKFIQIYKPVHKGVSIVGKEAYADYREFSKIRDPKKFKYYTDYRRITRKIWKRIADSSIEYESGVYDKDFFYLVPQVMLNRPFIELPNGKIKTNDHSNGDVYTPIFCNLLKDINHYCWSVDGTFVRTYSTKLYDTINKYVPKYYFILPTLIKNKL